jgi:F-type H+-transporting ATPase subunit epsilon
MAELLKFELVSPEKLLMSADVKQVVVPGAEGDFSVFVNHAPVLSTMRPGVVDITEADGKTQRIFVRGGFAEVNPQGLTVLAEQAINMDDLNADMLAQEVKNAEEDVADAKTDEKRQKAQETLDHLKQLQTSL